MRRLNKATRIAFLTLVLLLTMALITTSAVIAKKNDKINEMNTVVAESKAQIDEINKKNAELEEKLKKSEKAEAEAKSKLDDKQKENDKLSDKNGKLEKENKELKNEIEKLSLKTGKVEAVKPAASEKNTEKSSQKEKKSSSKKVKPGSKVCYLTFDDGPSKNTLKILKILKKYDAKATFFVINTSDIEYVKKIHKAGHTVGLHAYSHDYSKIYDNTSAYFKDLNKISKKVEDLIGVKSDIIRFPGGSSNTVSAKYSRKIMTKLSKKVEKKGYYYFDWNISSGDADMRFPSASVIKNNILSQAKNKDSICVLMHDSSDKTATVKALPKVIEGLKKQGYRFEALTPESKGYHHPINN